MKLYDTFLPDPFNVYFPGAGLLKTSHDQDLEPLKRVLRDGASKQAAVVDVTDVARWLSEVNDSQTFSIHDFPNLAPPWPVAWFEYALPTRFNMGGEWEHQPENRRYRIAAIAHWDDDPEGDGWLLLLSVFLSDRDDPKATLGFQGNVGFRVLPDGSTVPLVNDDPDYWYLTAPQATIKAIGGETLSRNVRNFAYPILMAVSLLHCRNVKVMDNEVPPKVAAKRRKAGKPVGVTYKTLVIDGMKEVLRREGGVEKNGLKKALHICRGHFATYTEDKPLFGRITGTFWKPMHTRGNKERGEVKKDYTVIAGE